MIPHPAFNHIASRSRASLLHVELLSQARGARRCQCDPADLLRLVDSFPMVAGLLGAGREAMQKRPAESLRFGFAYLGHRYRVESLEGGAFRVLAWATRELLVQSPPGSV